MADHGWQQVASGVREHDGGTAGEARMTGGLELRASVQSLELGRPNLTVSVRRGTARAAHNVAAAAPQGSHRQRSGRQRQRKQRIADQTYHGGTLSRGVAAPIPGTCLRPLACVVCEFMLLCSPVMLDHPLDRRDCKRPSGKNALVGQWGSASRCCGIGRRRRAGDRCGSASPTGRGAYGFEDARRWRP